MVTSFLTYVMVAFGVACSEVHSSTFIPKEPSSSYLFGDSSIMMGLRLLLVDLGSSSCFKIEGILPRHFPLGLGGCAQGSQGSKCLLLSGFEREPWRYLPFCSIFPSIGLFLLLLLLLLLFFFFFSSFSSSSILFISASSFSYTSSSSPSFSSSSS